MLRLWLWTKRHKHLFLFLFPGLALYVIFMAYPLFSSLLYSLFHWDGFVRGSFTGIKNFKTVLTQWPYNVRFWNALLHNAIFFAITFTIQTTFSLFVAVLLSRKRPGNDFFQVVYLLPYTLSAVVTGFLWMLLLNPNWGAASQILDVLGLGELIAPWLGQVSTALVTVILINAWHWLGFPTLVYLAGIKGIPKELYEAALVDGATGWNTFRHITLPLLVPTIGSITILTFILDFNAFELVYVMQGASGSPYYSTDLLATLFYRIGFGDPTTGAGIGQFGLASSIAVLMLVLISIPSYFGIHLLQKRIIQY